MEYFLLSCRVTRENFYVFQMTFFRNDYFDPKLCLEIVYFCLVVIFPENSRTFEGMT